MLNRIFGVVSRRVNESSEVEVSRVPNAGQGRECCCLKELFGVLYLAVHLQIKDYLRERRDRRQLS
jgi:hypothetical protein